MKSICTITQKSIIKQADHVQPQVKEQIQVLLLIKQCCRYIQYGTILE